MEIKNIIVFITFLYKLNFVYTSNRDIEKKEITTDNAQEDHRISGVKYRIKVDENAVEELKRKRDDILKNITKGIDESIAMLQDTNDSVTLIKDLQELKDDIGRIKAGYMNASNDRADDTRRLSKLHNYMKHLTRDMQIRIKMDRKLVQEKASKMFKKLKEESEKRKKHKKALRTGDKRRYEKCPRFGSSHGTHTDGKAPNSTKYPCCRKCCKRSYIGCL